MTAHYFSLLSGYALAIGLWFLLNHFHPSLWRIEKEIKFDKPVLEFAFSIVAVISILGLGQLYVRKLLLPSDGSVLLDAINQFIIFSPTVILVFVRKQSLETLWLPTSKIVIRLLVGLLLAFGSITIYWLTKNDNIGLGTISSGIYHYKNTSHLVQVFMEDITIALLFVRLSAWIGRKWSIFIVAILFSAGHIPSLLASGATLMELSNLLLDAGLGVIVLFAVSKSRDIWWFFMIHFAMDMTQFVGE